jgi:hypothetical protein
LGRLADRRSSFDLSDLLSLCLSTLKSDLIRVSTRCTPSALDAKHILIIGAGVIVRFDTARTLLGLGYKPAVLAEQFASCDGK